MKTIYLCGPINGCSDAECKDWREEVKRALDGQFRFLDPMRRDYRGVEDEHFVEIVRGDYRDINDSDIVLAMADLPSWGTAMEIHHAHRRGKSVVVVCGQDRISPWLRFHSNAIVPSLDRAIEHLESIA